MTIKSALEKMIYHLKVIKPKYFHSLIIAIAQSENGIIALEIFRKSVGNHDSWNVAKNLYVKMSIEEKEEIHRKMISHVELINFD